MVMRSRSTNGLDIIRFHDILNYLFQHCSMLQKIKHALKEMKTKIKHQRFQPLNVLKDLILRQVDIYIYLWKFSTDRHTCIYYTCI